MTQKDMYPTDEIYEATFNFTEKDSKIEHFEQLGYEGANFVLMTGSVLINILIPVLANAFKLLVLKITYKCKYRKCSRKIGSKITS
jgi:hypothetical protein